MGGSLLLADKIGSGHSMALGYTIMVASFLLIYFGIRIYRDNTLAGQISFGPDNEATCQVSALSLTRPVFNDVGLATARVNCSVFTLQCSDRRRPRCEL